MTCDRHAAGAARSALEHLAAALEPGAFATALVTGIDRLPRLAVTCRKTRVTEQVHALEGWYFWEWLEAIGPTDDPPATARHITAVLRIYAGLEPAGRSQP